MIAAKEIDEMTAEILHELDGLGPEDLDRLLRSWKATLEANKNNGDWKGYHFILLQ